MRREGLGEGPVADEDACLDVPVECIRGEVRGGDEDLLVVVDDRLGVDHRPGAVIRVDGTWVVLDICAPGHVRLKSVAKRLTFASAADVSCLRSIFSSSVTASRGIASIRLASVPKFPAGLWITNVDTQRRSRADPNSCS